MKYLIFITPSNFRDETVSMMKRFFDKWNVGYEITSYSKKECTGTHGAMYKPDINTGVVSTNNYDGIIFVDGTGIEEYKLFEYRPLLDLVSEFNNKNKLIGAVSNSIKVLARANIIKDRKISTPMDEDTKRMVQLFHGVVSDNPIEISKNIVTIKSSSGLEGPLQEMLQSIGVM